jgi:hypothetical protein
VLRQSHSAKGGSFYTYPVQTNAEKYPGNIATSQFSPGQMYTLFLPAYSNMQKLMKRLTGNLRYSFISVEIIHKIIVKGKGHFIIINSAAERSRFINATI